MRLARPIEQVWQTGVAVSLVAGLIGCQESRVGDPCTPEDENIPSFAGFDEGEVNVESRSFQCVTRVCLVNHFRGRTECPNGQTEEQAAAVVEALDRGNKDDALEVSACQVPGGSEPITVPVSPQFVDRQNDDTAYCSCRCDGPDPNASYCECPSGYACEELVQDLGFSSNLAGSYCVRDGTQWDASRPPTSECSGVAQSCTEDI